MGNSERGGRGGRRRSNVSASSGHSSVGSKVLEEAREKQSAIDKELAIAEQLNKFLKAQKSSQDRLDALRKENKALQQKALQLNSGEPVPGQNKGQSMFDLLAAASKGAPTRKGGVAATARNTATATVAEDEFVFPNTRKYANATRKRATGERAKESPRGSAEKAKDAAKGATEKSVKRRPSGEAKKATEAKAATSHSPSKTARKAAEGETSRGEGEIRTATTKASTLLGTWRLFNSPHDLRHHSMYDAVGPLKRALGLRIGGDLKGEVVNRALAKTASNRKDGVVGIPPNLVNFATFCWVADGINSMASARLNIIWDVPRSSIALVAHLLPPKLALPPPPSRGQGKTVAWGLGTKGAPVALPRAVADPQAVPEGVLKLCEDARRATEIMSAASEISGYQQLAKSLYRTDPATFLLAAQRVETNAIIKSSILASPTDIGKAAPSKGKSGGTIRLNEKEYRVSEHGSSASTESGQIIYNTCLYNCVSSRLEAHQKKLYPSVASLRNAAVMELGKSNTYANTLLKAQLQHGKAIYGCKSVAEYCKFMTANNAMGGPLEVWAISQLLRTPISMAVHTHATAEAPERVDLHPVMYAVDHRKKWVGEKVMTLFLKNRHWQVVEQEANTIVQLNPSKQIFTKASGEVTVVHDSDSEDGAGDTGTHTAGTAAVPAANAAPTDVIRLAAAGAPPPPQEEEVATGPSANGATPPMNANCTEDAAGAAPADVGALPPHPTNTGATPEEAGEEEQEEVVELRRSLRFGKKKKSAGIGPNASRRAATTGIPPGSGRKALKVMRLRTPNTGKKKAVTGRSPLDAGTSRVVANHEQ
jgi:hypothetical protein